ncbi:MAG: GAF domain-containing protein [Treponemataceae bacterium]|nr:GAF domain-containing protein [Treponemataceae bacterium]
MDGAVGRKEMNFLSIVELERRLNEIQDVDILLEQILTEARRIVNADAGSIYVLSGTAEKRLAIKHSQNDTQLRRLSAGEKLPYLSFSFPIDEKSIAGYVACTGKNLNIEDVYALPGALPYKFNRQMDVETDYRTKSMLTVPLKSAGGTLLGVLQIINALDGDGAVIPFGADAELYVEHFAISAAQILHRAYSASGMVRRMLRLSEFRDPKETYPHVERVSSISLEIYDRWAFDNCVPEGERARFRDNLKIAAKFHDIGKVGISDLILKKTWPRFTDGERSVMKGHTCIGAMLFHPAETELDKMCIDVALHHHERWDGADSGYPGAFSVADSTVQTAPEATAASAECKYEIGGELSVFRPLKGWEIPLAARIVAVADVFDALSHKRCYKEAWSLDDAFSEIEGGSGTQFDPEVVQSFLKIRGRVAAIVSAIPDDAEE